MCYLNASILAWRENPSRALLEASQEQENREARRAQKKPRPPRLRGGRGYVLDSLRTMTCPLLWRVAVRAIYLSYFKQSLSWRSDSSIALIASTRWPPKSWAACSRWSLARRSEPMASRISGWGSGKAAGAAAGCGVAAGTAAAGVLGDAGVDVTDRHSASANITREDRVRIFSFIVCSMKFKIFSRGSRNAPRGYHSIPRGVLWKKG